jgi:hypothetical protein
VGEACDHRDGWQGVDGPGNPSQKPLYPAGDQARGPEGHNEADAQDDEGDEDGGQEEEFKEPGEGKVRLGDQKGEEASQGHGDEDHAQTQDQGVSESLKEVGVVEEVAEGLEGEALDRGEEGGREEALVSQDPNGRQDHGPHHPHQEGKGPGEGGAVGTHGSTGREPPDARR